MTSKNISSDLSARIRILSFILIILVVFIHAYHVTWETQSFALDKLNHFIQYFISQEICRISVPLFFIISGYLFFVNPRLSANWFINKWRRRISSLVMPYLLWSFIGIVSLYLMQEIPFTSYFFTHKLLKDYTLFECINKLIWDPIPYQLWFLRYLFVYILFTPLIYFILKNNQILLPSIIIISLLVIFPFLSHYDLIKSYSSGAVLYFGGYFLLGSIFSINDVKYISNNKVLSGSLICFAWLILCILDTYTTVIHNFKIYGLHDLSIFIGIFFIWLVSGSLIKFFDHSKPVLLSSYTFFIYAAHEPLLTILKKGGYFLLKDQSTFLFILLYFACPLTTIALCIAMAILLNRQCPKVYSLLTGFR